MTVVARGFWLLRGRLARVSALSRSAVSPFAAPGAAGQAFRGFRSSGVRTSREKRFHLPEVATVCLPTCPHPRYDAIIISGTEMAEQIQKEIQHGVDSWVSLGNRRPHLSIILVGDNPASHTYVRRKIKAAAAVGICSEIILKPKDVSQEELLDITDHLNADPRVSGILVQLPLPDHVDERTVCNGIAPEKDVDGFHIINIGRLCLDQHSLIPATASAVWEIIRRTGIETFGKNVVVAGRSKNVGMPIAMLLHTDGEHERPGGDATVTIAHRYTPKEQLKIHSLLADVIIAAAGIPKLITSDMVKEGAAVIDVGINYIHDPITRKTKLVGDVDFEAVKKKASFITPVPGGVGPMTVAMLLKNTLLAAKKIIY
ncbi:bifunctional methylenetetrahydrofolate dehydrogenase/cyclohydrolase 2, mitochondrial isoform X1 [Muntiacus reevesi]|uniref:bifunctional methylenetetrahydrofolate dehydrogenase/cyclohydrolase 2, mitochondrial isoform X1 n=1 Tax=Muntiacus reevesi TaxID=9886 RepID=UPI003306EDE0